MSKHKKGDSYQIKDHQLYFSRIGVLIRLFSENKISSKKRWMRFKIFFFAIFTQIFMLLQQLFYATRFRKVDLKKNSPVFILGHWRCGTTHLHYLMAKDPNLGFVSNYNGFMITFGLLGRGWLDTVLSRFVPEKRPMDNVGMTMFSPSEEEQAVANLSVAAGVQSFFFPKNRSYFNKYTTLRDASPKEKKAWQKAYDMVLRIVTVSNKGKRLILKNPSNTARPKELAELYPEAKFIFIHRNPFDVYRSTLILQKKMTYTQYLQDMSDVDIDDMIFENYSELLKAYIAKRNSVLAGNLIEIGYDELNADGIGTMKKAYEYLGLPGWEQAMPEMQAYLDSVENYERNIFKPLPPEIVARIQKEWAFSFDEWGYSFEHSEHSMKIRKQM